jgi:hypothetical protein
MEMRLKFGNARIVFNANQYNHAGDIDETSFGGGDAAVSVRDWLRVYKRQEFSTYSTDVEEIRDFYREDKNARVSISNDDFIVFLDAIGREPRRNYEIGWNGLSYWLCHDITHAKHDVRGGSVNVDASAEDRTLYDGAILARKHGTKLEQIVRELVRAETGYRERFKQSTSALDRFLHEIEK